MLPNKSFLSLPSPIRSRQRKPRLCYLHWTLFWKERGKEESWTALRSASKRHLFILSPNSYLMPHYFQSLQKSSRKLYNRQVKGQQGVGVTWRMTVPSHLFPTGVASISFQLLIPHREVTLASSTGGLLVEKWVPSNPWGTNPFLTTTHPLKQCPGQRCHRPTRPCCPLRPKVWATRAWLARSYLSIKRVGQKISGSILLLHPILTAKSHTHTPSLYRQSSMSPTSLKAEDLEPPNVHMCFLLLRLLSPSAAHPTFNPPPSLHSPPSHLSTPKHKIESK